MPRMNWENSKVKDDNSGFKEQSQKIIKLLEAAKGKPLKKFPVPPFTKWLNGKLLQIKRGYIEIEYTTRKEMANPANIVHGGAQSGMIDDTIGITCATLGYKNFLLTIDLRVDYLGRIPIGETVKVVGEIIREGKRIINAEAKIYLLTGKLVARGQSNLLRADIKPNYTNHPIYDEQKQEYKE